MPLVRVPCRGLGSNGVRDGCQLTTHADAYRVVCILAHIHRLGEESVLDGGLRV